MRHALKDRSACVPSPRVVSQIHRLPFDRLRANGDILKSFNFFAHAELVEA